MFNVFFPFLSAARAPFASPAAHVHPGFRFRVLAAEATGEHNVCHLYESPLEANYSKVG